MVKKQTFIFFAIRMLKIGIGWFFWKKKTSNHLGNFVIQKYVMF